MRGAHRYARTIARMVVLAVGAVTLCSSVVLYSALLPSAALAAPPSPHWGGIHAGGAVGEQADAATVNVLDFGADPHSHNDSTAAFNAAFKHAQAVANGLGGADDGA